MTALPIRPPAKPESVCLLCSQDFLADSAESIYCLYCSEKVAKAEARLEANDPLAHWAVQRWARLAENSSEYEDALQEAKMAMYRAAMAFEEKRGVKFGTLACICMRNQLIYWADKHHRYGYTALGEMRPMPHLRLVVPPDEDAPAHDEWHADPFDHVEAFEDSEQLQRAMAWLFRWRPQMAKVIYGKYFQGLTNGEISDRLSLSRPAVARMIVLGRDYLARRILLEVELAG